MNEELESRLVNSIDKVEQWVAASEDFVAEQAPLVVDEIIRWGVLKYSLLVLLGAVFLAIGAVLIRAGFVFQKKAHDGRPDSRAEAIYRKEGISGDFLLYGEGCNGFAFASWLAGSFSSFIGFAFTVTNIGSLAYVWVAPRLYVLDQVSQLIN